MKMKFQKKKQAGFSLLEVLIAVGLLSLVSLGFMSMMDNVVRFQRGAQAKDQQKEASSEIRSFLSDPAACLNSITTAGAVPIASITGPGNAVAFTNLEDNLGVARYSTNDPDRSGLLTFQRYRLEQYDAPSQSAILRVIMSKTGSASGSLEIQDTVILHIRTDTVAPFNINYCVAIGRQTDSYWRITPGNNANIFFGDAVVGRVGIGTNAPPEKLTVNGNTQVTGNIYANTTTPVAALPLVVQGVGYFGGNIGIGILAPTERMEVLGNVQADMFLFNSDRRLKKDIDIAPGLDQIRRLQGHSYRWIKDGRFDTGLIAQEVEAEMPHLVRTNRQGMKSVNYMGLVPILIEGSKDLYNEHLKLLKRVEELEIEMKQLKFRQKPDAEVAPEQD